MQQIYEKLVEAIRAEYLSSSQDYPWIIGFSGGKDSTLVAQLVFAALMDISPSRLNRKVHVIANDTLVESPLVVSHLMQSLQEIEAGAGIHNLPVTVATTTPELAHTFWYLLIGKGYPSPNQQMRWCTDRLKIQPTSRYIREQVAANGAAIILLGVRSNESEVRRRRIDSYQNYADSNLSPHNSLVGAYIYRPIVELTTDEVWELLSSFAPAWGGDNSRLVKLYRDAAGGECPIVLSQEDAPGCGTNSSRFGCWTCTVVEKDRSLQGFVDSGNVQYAPLIDFSRLAQGNSQRPDPAPKPPPLRKNHRGQWAIGAWPVHRGSAPDDFAAPTGHRKSLWREPDQRCRNRSHSSRLGRRLDTAKPEGIHQ